MPSCLYVERNPVKYFQLFWNKWSSGFTLQTRNGHRVLDVCGLTVTGSQKVPCLIYCCSYYTFLQMGYYQDAAVDHGNAIKSLLITSTKVTQSINIGLLQDDKTHLKTKVYEKKRKKVQNTKYTTMYDKITSVRIGEYDTAG